MSVLLHSRAAALSSQLWLLNLNPNNKQPLPKLSPIANQIFIILILISPTLLPLSVLLSGLPTTICPVTVTPSLPSSSSSYPTPSCPLLPQTCTHSISSNLAVCPWVHTVAKAHCSLFICTLYLCPETTIPSFSQ